MEIMKRLFKEEEGQGMLEYALIIGLISITAIFLLPEIGTKVAAIFQKIQDALPAAAAPAAAAAPKV